MNINSDLSDSAILGELGARLTAARLAGNLTQAQLATQAGVSKRTVERLESGAVAVQLTALLRVCRALSLLDRFDALIPPPQPSPMAQLKLQGRRRRRASGEKTPAGTPKPWTWGEP